MSTLTFSVHGTPGAQGSKRHVGNGIMVESSKKVKPWRSDVKAAAERARVSVDWPPWHGPVSVSVTFWFPRPKSHYRTGRNAHLLRLTAPAYPTSLGQGDIDKLLRSSFDAIVAAGVIADDKLVAEVRAAKRWLVPGATPGATIAVTTLTLEAVPS